MKRFLLACVLTGAFAPVARAQETEANEETAEVSGPAEGSGEFEGFSGERGPAAARKGAKAKPTTKKRAAPTNARKSGADSEEGWIIRRDEKGRLVKVPRRQTFKFSGTDVEAGANRPSQTVLGQRPVYRKTTLIPERSSFRREFYEASGYSASGRSE